MSRFTVAALAKASGVNTETIRYYEQIGLLPPPARLANGYRHYGADSVTRLGFIRRARELGFALDEVRGLLDLAAHPDAPCHDADALVARQLASVEARIRDLQQLAASLRTLQGCQSKEAAHCQLLEALQERHCCHAASDENSMN